MDNYAVRDYYGGFSIMKITKILGAASAAVVSAAVMAASAGAYEAFLMYASSDWSVQCMEATSANATTADVTGDGTYTVSISGFEWEDEETAEMVPATANGATVFCVDIDGLANALGCGKDAEGYEGLQTAAEKMAFAQATGLTISDVVITATNSDGTSTDIAVDESKLYYGDIEGNGKITQYEGGFTDYQAAVLRKEVEAEAMEAGNPKAGVKSDKSKDEKSEEDSKSSKKTWNGGPKKLRFTYQEQKDWDVIESQIEKLEEEIADLDVQMEKVASDFVKLKELMDRKAQAESELDAKMERWMYLNDLAEKIEKQ